jgi:hypothetical protein
MGSGIVNIFDKIILEDITEKNNTEKKINIYSLYIEYSNYLKKAELDSKKRHLELLEEGKNPDGTLINKL